MSRTLPPFKFKQFSITHEKCAMKIGVDGVLIGAWTNTQAPTEILDIGTGSGLISLMMQQKYPDASITAIEPNEVAFEEAKGNFDNSPFGKKPEIELTDLQNFNSSKQFDLIISNPPFFEEAIPSGNLNRDQARQAKFLPLQDFMTTSAKLLSENGVFNFIYPTQQTTQVLKLANHANLHVVNTTVVLPNEKKSSKRTLFSFSKKTQDLINNELTIKNSNGEFTQEYKDLTKDFYINF
jgi:tRNA1Val (adenine37-N6)-methyltransferase